VVDVCVVVEENDAAVPLIDIATAPVALVAVTPAASLSEIFNIVDPTAFADRVLGEPLAIETPT